jgi:hypothetical protein
MAPDENAQPATVGAFLRGGPGDSREIEPAEPLPGHLDGDVLRRIRDVQTSRTLVERDGGT